MKRIILLIGVVVSLFAIQTVLAQQTGVITYEMKINLHRNIPPDREGMKQMIPEFRTTKQQLFYDAAESLYKPIIEDSEEDMTVQRNGGGGARFGFRMQQQNSEMYFNANESMGLTSQEFMGKQYLITDSLNVAPWKFGSMTKVIQGYECRMAYYTDTTRRDRPQEVTAWYTDKLRPFLGPERYYSLPGAVLAIDINNGERTIVAQKVELRELKKNELKAPSKGEPITQYEFNKMMRERFEQMRQQNGGRQMMIRN